ncbi:MAG: hypothetical protein ACRDPI_01090 [Nocardioidaceae bacterium]
MLGPLPRRYRFVVSLVALVCFVGVGAWLAARTALPLLPSVGALVGAAVGVAVVLLLMHDFYAREPRPVRLSVRRHR